MYNERRKMASLLDHLASDQVITEAFRWLCATRARYHHNDDVWHALSVAQQTVERGAARISQLYEQGRAGLAGMRVERG